MRRLLVLALPLFVAAAHAQEKWVESSVALSLTLSETGDQQLKPAGTGKTTRTVTLDKFSVGNRHILEALKAEGLIPEITNWSLVAIWANWPDQDPVAGNTYRFYARKGSGKNRQTVAVPSSILSIVPLVTEVGVKHILANEDESILSGSTETYKVYTEVRFDIGEIEGSPSGVHSGIGDYKKISGEQAGRYVPRASKAVLSGLFSRDGETADGVIEGGISFGAGVFVNSYDYEAPSGTMSGSVSISIGSIDSIIPAPVSIHDIAPVSSSGTLVISGGNTHTGTTTTISSGATLNATGSTATLAGASGLIKQGAGTLTLSGGNTYTGAITVNEGTTLHLGSGAATSLGSTLTFSLESAGNFIAANGGTFQFFDGSTLNLAPGATFDLSTFNGQQLGTSTTFTINPADGTLTGTLVPAETQPAPPAP